MDFGLTPPQTLGLTPAQILAAQPQAATPFIWGQGGTRLTPDDILRKRQMAAAETQAGMDYSPVGSWTQGLARVAQALAGRFDERSADRAAATNSDYEKQILASLTNGSGNGPAALTAMADPYLSEGGRSVASLLAKQQFKQPTEPPEIIKLATVANDTSQPLWARDAAKGRIAALNDPVITLPGGGLATRSMALGMMGGDQVSSGPPDGAIDYLRSNPSLAPDFDAKYGAGSAAKYLSGGAPQTSDLGIPPNAVSPSGSTPTVLSRADAAPFIKSLGPEGFQRWMAAHNIRLGN